MTELGVPFKSMNQMVMWNESIQVGSLGKGLR